MARDLFVPHGHEVDGALGQCRQDSDIGVPAEAEDVLHAPPFQEVDDMLGDGLFSCSCRDVHHATSSE